MSAPKSMSSADREMSHPSHRALVLVNAGCLARRGLSNHDLAQVCASAGLHVDIQLAGAAPTQDDLQRWLAERPSRVIAAGGDGTVHHLINALTLASSSICEPHLPALGILPLGTANDFARSIGLPLDLGEAARIIAEGATRPIDLGWANGVRFLNTVHIGDLADTSRHVYPWLKHGIGAWAYALAVLWMAWRVKPFRAVLAGDTNHPPVQALHMAIGNGRYFGGGMPISNEATLDDGQLDFMFIPACRRGWIARALHGLLSGQGLLLPVVQRWRAAALTIELEGSPSISLDGEPFSATSQLVLRVLPGAITLYAPV